MIRFQNVEAVEIQVLDRGLANKECIALQVKSQFNVGKLGLLIGYRGDTGVTTPYRDHFFWFGEVELSDGDWIFLFTGNGDSRTTELPGGKYLYVTYWGKEHTLFADSRIVPVLVEIGGVSIPLPPQNSPQGLLTAADSTDPE
jgi:hypothetical protein